MKTLFSLKLKIGAILTTAAILSTAMPMTGFAATATEAPELLVNGDFSSVETEGKTYGETNQVTLEAGEVPSDWELYYDESKYNNNSGNASDASVTTKGVLNLKDDAFYAKQKVTGIEAGEFYTLSFVASTHGSSNSSVTVSFLNYDEATGTYSTLADYATANSVTLMQAAFGAEASKDIDFTSVKYTFRSKAEDKMVPNKSYKLNFVAPPYTNAVEIVLHNDKDLGASTSSSYYALFDNVSLKLGTEVVNNGNFQAYGEAADETGAYTPQFWQRNATADGYKMATSAGANMGSTYLLLNANSKYRLTFKYKHTIGDNVSDKTPYIIVTDMNDYSTVAFSGTQIATDGDWGIYETYFTTDAFTSNDAGLVNIGLKANTRALTEGESWDEGYAVYYDDFSITEAATMNINAAGGIDVIYTPAYIGDTVDLIVATYDKATGVLDDIDVVEMGTDAETGIWQKFTQAVSLSSDVKVFLWDGIGTMKPVASSIARPSYTKTVPYKWVFDTVGYVPTLADGIGYNSTGTNGSVSVTVNGLTLANSTLDGIKDSHRVDFNFDPVATGKLYAELKFVGQYTNCHDGLVIISDSDGNRIAGIATEGRGAKSAKVWQDIAWSAKDVQNTSWKGGAVVKLELDFTNGKYKVYQNGGQLSSTSLGNEFALPAGANASKLTFNYSNNGDYLTYVKLCTEEVTATQTETAYTMNVGDTQQAGIAYEPTNATMYDMTFASSNTAIAEVTANGLITAKRAGTATITATSAFYDVNYEYVVTIPETVTVTPVTLNYEDNFTSGQEIKDLAGWSILNRQPNTVLSTQDGKLVATGIAATTNETGAAQAKLVFQPASSGKLVIELDYKNLSGDFANVAASNGLVNIYDTDGTRVAGIRAVGRGKFNVYTGAGASAANDSIQARRFNEIKIEIDLDAKTYQVWSGETAVTVGGNATFALTDAAVALAEAGTLDVSSFEITFTNEGDYIDNVKVYVPEA